MLDGFHSLPATDSQLAAVARALEDFRVHWQSFPNMPFPCAFEGGIEDVKALDYLNYEGLGYPKSGLDSASLVWGNVLVQQLGMSWATGSRGELLVTHEAVGNRITVWPYARALEGQERSCPQFGRYAWLLEGVMRDCLSLGDLSDTSVAWCHQVIGEWKLGTPWS